MRNHFLLVSLLVLAACATPRESCISNAQRELRTVNSLIAEAQGNINRGYAIAEVQDVRTRRTRCTGTNDDGSTFTFPCEETETVRRQVPVAIDVTAERAKLASLQQQKARLEPATQAAIQQCVAIHPE
ncbi:MAG: hypothetical protein JJT81_12260 [Rubellimicrobium sp.]|nr:hypothetical protein [Rubellimicrobium sp.]